MHYFVRHRYPSIERHCLFWCGMLSGNCVFGVGHASLRSVKFVGHVAGGGVILLLIFRFIIPVVFHANEGGWVRQNTTVVGLYLLV